MNVSVCAPEAVTHNDVRRVHVLREDRLAHYPEFRAFFVRMFALDDLAMDRPGYLRGPSGNAYELIFLGRSGERFPSGVEIYALVEALEPMDETAVDNDLWQILRWMFAGVGGEWSVDTLDQTGRLYRIPAAILVDGAATG
ncbi:MAG: hypothetical protein K2Y51_10565 [Gammaproteobacteria bacterium]|nr:hypothetical protein [Gammaproteobacteria bacterium]